MSRAAAFAFAVAAVAQAQPAAGAGASTPARVTIIDAMTVRMSWAMAMPSVQSGASGAAFMGNTPTMAMGMMMPANARLMVRREDDTGAPVTAPASFEVVTTGGDEALIVRTAASTEVWIARDGAIMGGALAGGTAASIDVGRGLSRISTGDSGPTPGAATLVVVVQYN